MSSFSPSTNIMGIHIFFYISIHIHPKQHSFVHIISFVPYTLDIHSLKQLNVLSYTIQSFLLTFRIRQSKKFQSKLTYTISHASSPATNDEMTEIELPAQNGEIRKFQNYLGLPYCRVIKIGTFIANQKISCQGCRFC